MEGKGMRQGNLDEVTIEIREEMIKNLIISSGKFDDSHLMGWKRLILP
jgi:sporulation protein YlmC with PRC-barrel domain